MRLTLLIPELAWSNPDDRSVYAALDASALAGLLARSAPDVAPAQSGEEWLAQAGGYATAPLAALRAAGDGLDPGSDEWICADPVHLRFHQERLILADASQLAVAADESATLLAALNEAFPDLGEFVAAAPERWFLRLRQPVTQAWPPLSQAVGREVRLDPLLADPVLKRLGNEVQMLLHAHPLNRAREAAGRLTINSLWLWGAGALPKPLPVAPAGIVSASPLGRGLARLAGRPAPMPPAGLAELLAAPPAPALIVELDALQQAASFENASDYLEVWQRLDHDWFAGLAPALRSGRIETLEIVAPSAFGLLRWSLGRLAAWRFWGGSQAFSARVAALVDRGNS